MSKAKIQEGRVFSVALPYDRTSGQFALVGAIGGVVQVTGLSTEVRPIDRYGVHTLAKATGETWAVGDQLYWDNTNKAFTKTSSGNTAWGRAAAVQASGDTTGAVLLSGNG